MRNTITTRKDAHLGQTFGPKYERFGIHAKNRRVRFRAISYFFCCYPQCFVDLLLETPLLYFSMKLVRAHLTLGISPNMQCKAALLSNLHLLSYFLKSAMHV